MTILSLETTEKQGERDNPTTAKSQRHDTILKHNKITLTI